MYVKVRSERRTEPWALTAAEVLGAQGTDPDRGLDPNEAARREAEFGPNRLLVAVRERTWQIVARQFRSIVVALLAGAAATSFAFDDLVEGTAIVAVLMLNAAIGASTELRAVRSMKALREFDRVEVNVKRGDRIIRISSDAIVPGDIIVVGGGDVVPADARLTEAWGLQADESTLTGESVPVEKSIDPLEPSCALADRRNMLFKGTHVTRGSATAVVIATGPNTELGRISALIAQPGHRATPLERSLAELGRRLVWVTIGVALLVALSSLVTERDVLQTIQTAIALAVAAVPEGLPIVATLALARGMLRMARRNALVERLSAVEALGSTSVILTDKTGTLTANKMTVERLVVADRDVTTAELTSPSPGADRDPLVQRLLTLAVLCNEAAEVEAGTIGDPMEVALIEAAGVAGIDRRALLDEMPRIGEEPFDPIVKMMATYHRMSGRVLVAVKGAPERVIAGCTSQTDGFTVRTLDVQAWLSRADAMAATGLRVLAVAEKRVPAVTSPAFSDLTMVGLIALWDPPRPQVAESIGACKRAGIKVVMVTGDHHGTAGAIGRAIGLPVVEGRSAPGSDLRPLEHLSEDDVMRLRNVAVFSRATPEEKLSLLELHQGAGEVVAMIGDGVNDAPALKRADIGVAMGRRGTQVARDASAMILLDDHFETIVDAIGHGRAIFDNIRRFVVYLLSCNLSEILVVGLASMVDAPLPILPLQILFLNLVTDVFPALALATTKSSANVLSRPPRPATEPVLTTRHWRSIGAWGGVITAAVLGGLAIARIWMHLPVAEATTISFLILAFAQLVHVFDMGRDGRFVHEVTRNRTVWLATLLCAGLLLTALYVEPVAEVLHLVTPGAGGWLLVAAMSIIPLTILRFVTVRPSPSFAL